MRTSRLAVAVLVVLAAGCSESASEPTALDRSAPTDGARFSVNVSTPAIDGLASPESALYDNAGDAYLISNLGDPFSSARDGFVLRYDPDTGTATRFVDDLISPTGMAILGDVLYVVDRDGVRTFDRATGAPLGTIALPAVSVSDGFIFHNDICGGADGRLYVTSTNLNGDLEVLGQSAIFLIEAGEAEVFARDLPLGPNGCILQGAKNVIFTSFGEGGVYRINASGKIQEVLNPEAVPGGNDSAVRIGNVWYITSWAGSAVYRVSANGKSVVPVVEDLPSPADMGYDATRNRLIVPSPFGNSVTFVELE